VLDHFQSGCRLPLPLLRARTQDEYDPSDEAVYGPLAAAFNDYGTVVDFPAAPKLAACARAH
jgi:hypothetical protein